MTIARRSCRYKIEWACRQCSRHSCVSMKWFEEHRCWKGKLEHRLESFEWQAGRWRGSAYVGRLGPVNEVLLAWATAGYNTSFPVVTFCGEQLSCTIGAIWRLRVPERTSNDLWSKTTPARTWWREHHPQKTVDQKLLRRFDSCCIKRWRTWATSFLQLAV